MIGATTDSIATSTMPVNKEFGDLMNTNEHSYKQSAVICVIIVLNVVVNSLVIAVIAYYPQLRKVRTTLFMFSLSVSDLAAGLPSAALCSATTPKVADMVGVLPKVHAFMTWWFAFNSMYSLCWLTISIAIAILKPFKVEQLLSHKGCYFVIGLNRIIGCVLDAYLLR